jgi:type-F conjugative transfer system pilin assembly protein TrbC
VKKIAIVSLIAWTTLHMSSFSAIGATFYIDTPDLCSSLERTERNRIYLVSKGDCPKTPGKLAVTPGEEAEEFEIYVNGVYWKKQTLTRFDIDSIGEVNDRGEKLSKTLTIPVNPFAGEGAERAKETNDFFRSGEFQKRVVAEQERLKREIFGGRIQEYYQGAPDAASAMAGELPANERIYIFISSSIPRETLRNYVRDVAKLRDPNVKLVMRGLIGGVKYIKPTMRFVSGILLKDPACNPEKRRCERYAAGVNVDPLLFGRYGIKEVPAIAYARNVTVLDAEMSEGMERNVKSGDYYTIHGDVALTYALERFRAETGSKPLEALVRELNAGFYGGKEIRRETHGR